MSIWYRLGSGLAAGAALLTLTAASSPQTGSAHGAAPEATPLTVEAPAQQGMLGAYAAYRHIPATDVSRSYREVDAARLRGGTEWAVVGFLPSASAPQSVQLGFQDGGGFGVFTRAAGGAWQLKGLGGEPLGCAATRLPDAVRRLWRLPGCAALAGTSERPIERRQASQAGTSADIASVALSNVGVADTPASTDWGFDCDPYTTLDGVGVSHHRCGMDTTFSVRDQNELWCADFAKYVWTTAGVTTDLTTLNPGANSFAVWGAQQGEQLAFRGIPAVGDAVVFYPRNVWKKALLGGTSRHPYPAMADHVAIVSGITNGLPDLVNGDFMGSTNISVETVDSVSLRQYAAEIWGPGEKWVVVSPNLPTGVGTGGGGWAPGH